MGSSAKFPSGLNNWAGSDRPTRLDFVGDNEILDQNAMWKDEYDSNGDIANAGGIAEFALAKSVYDPAGAVAGAGGITAAISAAVSANEGFTPYVHSKSGTLHTLTGAAGPNIKFTAVADYNEGDTFSVNGTVCSAQTGDGQPLAGRSFTAGAVVVCYRGGNVLNFKTGGMGLNYRIVVSAARPITAHKNTLWVQSSIPLNRYAVGPVKPPDLDQTGDVHIKTGNSNTSFNALQVNTFTIQPQTALQKNSAGVWARCPLEYYNGLNWSTVTSTLWLLDGAETYNSITGGWATFADPVGWYKRGADPNPYQFFSSGGGSYRVGGIVTTLPIDLAGVRFLTLDYTGHPKYGDGSVGTPMNYLFITSTPGGNHRDHAIVLVSTTFSERHEMTLDVSSFNGSYYVGAGMMQSNTATNGISIWRIWGTY